MFSWNIMIKKPRNMFQYQISILGNETYFSPYLFEMRFKKILVNISWISIDSNYHNIL